MIFRFVAFLGLAVLLAMGGCKASKKFDSSVVVVSEASIRDVTSRAHQALNSGDLEALADVVTFPLVVRSHEWASTSGSYELTRPVDMAIGAETSLLASSGLGEVRLDSQLNEGLVISYEDVRENLEGSEYDWSDLTLIIYARGFGDVEHIVLFGVDNVSGKIKAIYYN